MHRQFSLEAIAHLNKSMIWFIAEEFDSYDISIEGEQVKKLILIYSLEHNMLSRMEVTNQLNFVTPVKKETK